MTKPLLIGKSFIYSWLNFYLSKENLKILELIFKLFFQQNIFKKLLATY